MMQVNNNHKTALSFLYYVQTTIGNSQQDITNSPIFASPVLVEPNGEEHVNLIQSINICYRGATTITGSIVSSSGSQTWTTISLNAPNPNSLTEITGDYNTENGWNFYLGKPVMSTLLDDTVTVVDLIKTTSNGHITGQITIQEVIGYSIISFFIAATTLTVTGKVKKTIFTFRYDGPSTFQTLFTLFKGKKAHVKRGSQQYLSKI